MRLHLSNLLLLLSQTTVVVVLVILRDDIHVEAIASNEKFNKRIKKFASSSPPLVSGARAPISFSILGGGGGDGATSTMSSNEEEEEKEVEGAKESEVIVENEIVVDGENVDEDGGESAISENTDEGEGEEAIANTDDITINVTPVDTADGDMDGDANADATRISIAAASQVQSPPPLNLGEEKSDFFPEEEEEDKVANERLDTHDENTASQTETKTCSATATAACSIHAQKQLGRVAVPALLAGGSLFGVSRIFSPTSASSSSSSPQPRKVSLQSMMTGNANSNAMKASNNKKINNDEVSDELAPMITILKVAFACLVASKI
mmetsp:Transcript_20705/g.31069  ORF Transcript_20705/g.31069 Transcript_20705/m.31069 type:complete len:323 (-) Transcript_20705:86-1054(-)